MKKLTVIVIASMVMFGCEKQASNKLAPKENIDKLGYEKMKSYYGDIDKFSNTVARRGNPNQFYFTCGNSWGDDLLPPSQGLAAEVDVKRLHVGSATMKSWWIAITNYYTNANGDNIKDWSQFGYAYDGQLFPAFFRYRWNLTKGTFGQSAPEIVYSGVNVPLVFNTKVRFEIKNIEGTNWWTFSRNGQEVFRANLEFSSFTGLHEACTESWGSPDFSPALMTYYMDWYKDGQWSHVSTGASNQMSWGINGQLQNPAFAQSQFIMGGSTPFPVNTTWLWSSN
jgi:hypothetical protein